MRIFKRTENTSTFTSGPVVCCPGEEEEYVIKGTELFAHHEVQDYFLLVSKMGEALFS